MFNQYTEQSPAAYPFRRFCKTYSVGETNARAEIKAGRLKAVRLGAKILITKPNADAWINSLPSAA